MGSVRTPIMRRPRHLPQDRRATLDPPPIGKSRFEGVSILGVDEHVWHHVSTKPVQDGGRGPKELTGMVDLTRDEHGKVHARLLDLVPGRSGETYRAWLTERGEAFRAGVEIATLDPFHGYKNAIDDQLEDARSVLDAFHVVKVRHEALCVRMEVRDLHRLVVAAAGLKLRAA